jgi:hypothetical protein
MEQNPSREANSSLGSQEIPRILWISKVHCRIYKSPSPLPILNQNKRVQSHALKINFNIILPSRSIGLPSGIASTRSVKIWEKAVLSYLSILSRNFLGRNEKTGKPNAQCRGVVFWKNGILKI